MSQRGPIEALLKLSPAFKPDISGACRGKVREYMNSHEYLVELPPRTRGSRMPLVKTFSPSTLYVFLWSTKLLIDKRLF